MHGNNIVIDGFDTSTIKTYYFANVTFNSGKILSQRVNMHEVLKLNDNALKCDDNEQIEFRDALWDRNVKFVAVDAVAGSGKSTLSIATAILYCKYGFTDENLSGSAIEIHLNDESKEYASRWKIEELIKRYSDHIAFPIYLHYEQKKYDDKGNETGKENKVDQVNSASALWKRSKSELKPADYNEFYKNMSIPILISN